MRAFVGLFAGFGQDLIEYLRSLRARLDEGALREVLGPGRSVEGDTRVVFGLEVGIERAEFARRDAIRTPVQLGRAEPIARELFPLAERLDNEPWMGSRPCTPDMMPIIGRAPKHANLWFAFGHELGLLRSEDRKEDGPS